MKFTRVIKLLEEEKTKVEQTQERLDDFSPGEVDELDSYHLEMVKATEILSK